MFSAIGSPRAYLAGTQSSLCQPDKCCYSTHLGWDGVGCHFSATEAEKWFVSTFKYRQFSAYTPTLFTWETTCCIETDIHTIGCPYCSSSDCDLKIENCFQLCAESHLLSKDKLTWITYLSTSWLTISDFICVFFISGMLWYQAWASPNGHLLEFTGCVTRLYSPVHVSYH